MYRGGKRRKRSKSSLPLKKKKERGKEAHEPTGEERSTLKRERYKRGQNVILQEKSPSDRGERESLLESRAQEGLFTSEGRKEDCFEYRPLTREDKMARRYNWTRNRKERI